MADISNPPLITNGRGQSRREYLALAILCFVNLINYMDRVTIAAVLDEVKLFYNLSDKESGFLQTVFVISYMIFAPVFGYLGDRYSRKVLMAVGVFFWSITTLLGSYPPSPENFHLFLILRALVGIGEASYSTIAPTLIGDIFPENRRTLALGFFYYAIPVGSGLGYMLGSGISKLFHNWFWALRVTPILGTVATLLIIFVLEDPPRGQADGGVQMASTSIKEDILDLCKNMSFVWATLGFTAATFALGAMSWWAPTFMLRAYAVSSPTEVDKTRVNFIFGVITCVGGAFGITLAVFLSQKLRVRYKRADPAICAAGLFAGVPLILVSVLLAAKQPIVTWTLFFFGLTFLSLNWSIVPDMLLYTVLPTRRGTASAMQILFSHMLGDAASPYIVGTISDALCPDCEKTKDAELMFTSLRDAMLLPVFVLIAGGIVFIFNVYTIVRDKERCQMQMQGENSLYKGDVSMSCCTDGDFVDKDDRYVVQFKENEAFKRMDESERKP